MIATKSGPAWAHRAGVNPRHSGPAAHPPPYPATPTADPQDGASAAALDATDRCRPVPLDRRAARAALCAVAAVILVVLAAITTGLPRADSRHDPAREAATRAGVSTERSGVVARLRLADRHLFTVLVTTLMDHDAERPTWVDARALLGCAPGSSFRVNDRLLPAGEPFPAGVFTLDWFARDCRPYGIAGPRLDGHLRFVMAHEEWGMSAARLPLDDARFALDGHWRRLARVDVASPISGSDSDESALLWAALTESASVPIGAARP